MLSGPITSWQIDGGTMETVTDFIFLGSKKAAMKLKDKDKSYPWKDSCEKARQHVKNRDIALLTKACIVKVMIFPIVMYRCESWIIKKGEHKRIDAFEFCCCRRLFRAPWTEEDQTSQS